MTPTARFFIGTVTAAGAAVFVTLTPREFAQPALTLVFLGTMLAVSLLKLRLPLGLGQSTMSMAYVVDFTVLVTLGADVAMLIAAVGVLTQCTVKVRRPQPWYRTAFSVAAVVLSVQAAGWVWSLMSGPEAATLLGSLLPLAAAAVLYFGVNTGLIASAVGLANATSPVRFWQRNFVATLPSYLLAAAIASTLVVFHDAYVLLAVAIAPMLLAHLGYGAWFRRIAARQSTASVSV